MRILGINGCNEKNASSYFALKYCLNEAKRLKAEVDLFDLYQEELPMFSVDKMKKAPEVVQKLIRKVSAADALIWSTPLYHGSLTGVFKNAIDWFELLASADPPYLTHKIIGLICVAGGNQGLQGINSMNFIARALRGWTVPYSVSIGNSYQVFDKNGTLKDTDLIKKIELLAHEAMEGARFMSQARGQGIFS